MPGAFPFSAPRFTDADEVKEKATLKEDELKRVEADLQGNSGEEWKDLETIDFMVSKLREFQTEVDALPQIQKQAYADAIAKVPQLVEEETNPMAFLRSVRYNAKLAAKRVATYWKIRKQIFCDKAYDPMTLTGAMRDDIDYFREGVLVHSGYDSSGRPIIIHENFRLKAVHVKQDKNQVLRSIFFGLHRICYDSPRTQWNGFVLLNSAKTYDLGTFEWKMVKTAMSIIKDAIPSKIATDHVMAGLSMQNLFVTLVMPIVKAMMDRETRQRLLYHCDHDAEIVKVLTENYGMSKDVIPLSVGGDFRFESHLDWIDEQLLKEGYHSLSKTKDDDGVVVGESQPEQEGGKE